MNLALLIGIPIILYILIYGWYLIFKYGLNNIFEGGHLYKEFLTIICFMVTSLLIVIFFMWASTITIKVF